MRVRLVLVDVVRVVGGQQGDAQVLGQAQQPVPDVPFDGQAVVHQLQEVVLAAEDVLIGGGDLAGLGVLVQPQPGLDRAGGAAGRRDDALGVLADQLHVHTGFAGRELPAVTGLGGQVEEIAQALHVPGPHRHMGEPAAAGDVFRALAVVRHGALPARAPEFLFTVAAEGGGDIGLDADDRFDVVEAFGHLVELVGAEHVPVIAHRDGGHRLACDFGEHGFEFLCAVEHGIFGVIVQVNKAVGHRPGTSTRRKGAPTLAAPGVREIVTARPGEDLLPRRIGDLRGLRRKIFQDGVAPFRQHRAPRDGTDSTARGLAVPGVPCLVRAGSPATESNSRM